MMGSPVDFDVWGLESSVYIGGSHVLCLCLMCAIKPALDLHRTLQRLHLNELG